MNRVIMLLSLKPILYGLIGMLISGTVFPICGVIIVRNNLMPMRYMLMHGVILGGIISVSFSLPLLPITIILNILLVLLMVKMGKGKDGSLGSSSTAMMVFTMALASLFSHVSGVPAKDTLEVLWGSPFALTLSDLYILFFLAVMTLIYITLFFRPLSMIFFDKEVAMSMGVKVDLHNTLMLLMTALVVSVSMKMVGALLIDTLVILPVIGAGKRAKGLKDLFVRSSLTGFILSLSGYFISLYFNLPTSGVLALLSVGAYAVESIAETISNRRIKNA